MALIATGCSGSDAGLIVGVASSLSDVGEELGRAFESPVELSAAGSQVLVSQVREGAPLDVVITADAATASAISSLVAEASQPVAIAGNRLAIAVAPGNPLGIETLDDLTEPSLRIVLAAPQVPAGAYTEKLLAISGVSLQASSLEASVRGVLTKIRLGEADAGIVYESDLRVEGVDGLPLPESINPAVEYYALALTGTRADAFVSFLRSTEAQRILAMNGFTS